jgi:small subunit ribosomal protein S13
MAETEMPQEIREKQEKERQMFASLIRIRGTDIRGEKNIYAGLARIKGVSFAMANALCHILKISPSKKVQDLSKEDIQKIEDAIKEPKVPGYFKNRRNDFETGEDKHLSTSDLDLEKEFDIKRMRKMKSYKGLRHSRGLPVRGQRTRSHFRKKGRNKVVGVKTKK